VQLPVTGTYTIVVDVSQGRSGSYTLILSADTSGALAIDSATPMEFTRIGQNGRYTFTGEAGKTYSWALTNMTTTPGGGQVGITMIKPDGTTFVSGYNCVAFSPTAGNCDISALPVGGTYTIVVDPLGTIVTGFDAWLTKTVEGGELVVNGATATYSTAAPAQNARYTISGTTGQTLRLVFAGNTVPASTLYVFKPDGGVLASRGTGGIASGTLDLPTLPLTGTYTVIVFVDGRTTGSINVQLQTR
jgi:hypothetical protein